MYVHNYQILNVLEVYRKKLSQGSGSETDRRASAPNGVDGAALSAQCTRQAIFDRVTAEIVDRIADAEPRNGFAEALAREYGQASLRRSHHKEVQFTYTAIDASDRKITNTLPVGQISPLLGRFETEGRVVKDGSDDMATAPE